MKALEITETILRDANQSLAATRIPIEDFIPILGDMNQAGYYSIECWGGATFDACLRYLNEDPWERLQTYRKLLPDSRLQMLMRGQCILGYRHYPDDVVREFVRRSIENGIDVIRIFDALNDVKNIAAAVDETVHCGGEASCAISYTVSPVHSLEAYAVLAREMEALGAQSICVKDMSGILGPDDAYRLITTLKETVDVPIVLHSHCTSGYAYMSYYEAIRAGADRVDTATSSFSGGTSQPSTEIIMEMARDLGRPVRLNGEKVKKVEDYFSVLRDRMEAEGKINYRSMIPNPDILRTQIPGGMYSNLIAQLEALGMQDKIQEVVREVPAVRADLGYPPLVTPVSQMVGVQAVTNVATGKRYQTVIREVRDYLEGKYGTPPGEISRELRRLSGEQDAFAGRRYADSMEPRYAQAVEQYRDMPYKPTDILSLLLFPKQAEDFLKKRYGRTEAEEGEEDEAPWKSGLPNPEEIPDFAAVSGREKSEEARGIFASLPGSVVRILVKEGEWVEKDRPLVVLETMKMENEIVSQISGRVTRVFVLAGDKVKKGDCLVEYEEEEK